MYSKQYSVAWRFVKGFVASGIASAIVVLNSGITISSVEDLKKFGVSLGVAFITGALMAAHKAMTWQE